MWIFNTDKYAKTLRGLVGLIAIVQVVLLGFYFLDNCHSHHEEACLTLVPKWPLWALFLPTIVAWSGFVIFLILNSRYQKFKKQANDPYLLAGTNTIIT